MKISQKRIRNVANYLAGIEINEDFFIGLIDIERFHAVLLKLEFSTELNVGELILPKIVGPLTRFNANGKYYPLKDLPKETYYIERYWTWEDWGGNEHSKIVYIPRERYQRSFIEPPSVELTVQQIGGNKILMGGKFINSPENYEDIKHCINLFLEIFGECDTLNFKQQIIQAPNVIRLNWRILPKGEYPWNKLESIINGRLSRLSKNKQFIVSDRFEKISSKNPDFVAFGAGGFNDYTVFGFEKKSIYVLESMKTGNAIYVFEKDWKEFSKLTKKEILDNKFHKARIIHKDYWEAELFNLI